MPQLIILLFLSLTSCQFLQKEEPIIEQALEQMAVDALTPNANQPTCHAKK